MWKLRSTGACTLRRGEGHPNVEGEVLPTSHWFLRSYLVPDLFTAPKTLPTKGLTPAMHIRNLHPHSVAGPVGEEETWKFLM